VGDHRLRVAGISLSVVFGRLGGIRGHTRSTAPADQASHSLAAQ